METIGILYGHMDPLVEEFVGFKVQDLYTQRWPLFLINDAVPEAPKPLNPKP